MSALSNLFNLLRRDAAEWEELRLSQLQFWHPGEAWSAATGLLALAVVLLIVRFVARQASAKHGVVLPALPASLRRSRGSLLVHAPAALFVLGVPCFILALADPFTALLTREVSFPGRRIGIVIDASISMRRAFTSTNARDTVRTTFLASVEAAQRFVELRRKGQYRDLIALVEFGSQPYVIMPFTSDYDNVLLSISLIGDPYELNQFPDGGTVIGRAIDELVGLYQAFNFVDASGNLMVIFSDGEDSNYQIGDKNLSQILQFAIDARIPVYLVRTNYDAVLARSFPTRPGSRPWNAPAAGSTRRVTKSLSTARLTTSIGAQPEPSSSSSTAASSPASRCSRSRPPRAGRSPRP